MRITVDGEVEFDGRVIPGNIYGFSGEEYVEITTGNGAGLQVLYNDLDLGTLGSFGEVINFVITVNGVQTPNANNYPDLYTNGNKHPRRYNDAYTMSY